MELLLCTMYDLPITRKPTEKNVGAHPDASKMGKSKLPTMEADRPNIITKDIVTVLKIVM